MSMVPLGPDPVISEAIDQPGMGLAQLVGTVLVGYANRPAVGQRAVRSVEHPQSGRTMLELQPRFETWSYRQLWDRVLAVTAALSGDPVTPGDRVAILGFTSVDYTTVDMALILLDAVSVPLQSGLSADRLRPVIGEAAPRLLATNIDNLPDAVELALDGAGPECVLVFDYHPDVDDERDVFDAARTRLAEGPVRLDTLADVIDRGCALGEQPVPCRDDDDLALLIYTSGSTGAPKGAMLTRRLVANFWRTAARAWGEPSGEPSVTLNFTPMSHVVGRTVLYGTLGNGGTAYFAARGDLSTFLDDLALVRPTELMFVPRIWEMLFQEFQSEVDRACADGADRATVQAAVTEQLRTQVLGGRFGAAWVTSAPISAALREFAESVLGIPLVNAYGSTEATIVLYDGVFRPPVTDYKLIDVPELGYFHTDRPYPRGELLLKTENVFAGYYRRPEVTAEVFDDDGYYRTGDIMAEVGPRHVRYLDRRNNVLKLSHGEFVTTSRLEAVFGTSPVIRQIYVYGNSTRSYLLAVIVPTPEALASVGNPDDLKPAISASLQEAAAAAGLQSYEIPRDFIVETTPFSSDNGLLTGIAKLGRPKLKQHYGERLERLYTALADGQAAELQTLIESGNAAPVLETISRAATAVLGGGVAGLSPDAHFLDLGGDSLSALTFANLLREIFGVQVPVGVIVAPTADLRALADYVEAQRQPGARRPTFADVHGDGATVLAAADLTLEKFLDLDTLSAAATLPPTATTVHTVLLTGATGFLGRRLVLDWLQRLSATGGRLICLIRATSDADARRRLDAVFATEPHLLHRYTELAAGHLEVIAGDKGEHRLGLDDDTWRRLADTVDLIVDPAALVNHVLPYRELFGPNVVGTAELIRLALTGTRKPYTYVSTISVGDQIEASQFVEDIDVRTASPHRTIDDTYANGYGNSKWAGEVLLAEANSRFGLPVTVFRCDLILSDTEYRGQLNVPDMFTRLILSVAASGIAPGSFYELDAHGNRQRAHYDGLPVGFIAEAITTLGASTDGGFLTYHVMNPHDDGIGLDEYVDWLIDAGQPISRVADYDQWLQRFATALRALPDAQRRFSLLPLLHSYEKPQAPVCGSVASTARFRAAVRATRIGAGGDIPHVTPALILKYVTDLKLLGLLASHGR
ncbi:carboxylic acid reductase [[Mycobacterium] zoologicum]|uniref:carboxylic acid reductase n=1 Tax=[Mycobacterium] zoologicum TaxID=2872311 RepID=UPI001CDA9631|nr:carboxylic acid reductase [Mycolicibacter sp. MYC101]MEB3062073.1 carboxylic acid reductase [Mycolicibacter sp. MYC101]